MEYIVIIIGAVLVNNIVLAQFLGLCPLFGVSSKISTAAGMGGAVLFVMTVASIVTYLLSTFLLEPFNIMYLQTITYIMVISSLVQMVEIVLKKVSPPLYQALGIFLPLMTTNCAILGVAILVFQQDLTLLQGVVFAISHSIGFTLAIVLLAGIREHMDLVNIPKGMKGNPIIMVTAGLLALAFMGFAGIV